MRKKSTRKFFVLTYQNENISFSFLLMLKARTQFSPQAGTHEHEEAKKKFQSRSETSLCGLYLYKISINSLQIFTNFALMMINGAFRALSFFHSLTQLVSPKEEFKLCELKTNWVYDSVINKNTLLNAARKFFAIYKKDFKEVIAISSLSWKFN